MVFGYEFVKLYKESKKRRKDGNQELVCEAAIQWNATNLTFCALCGIVGGTVGGLLGSGGGFVLGPLLLEIGVIPQVCHYSSHRIVSKRNPVNEFVIKQMPLFN